jgi:hypothetical protein
VLAEALGLIVWERLAVLRSLRTAGTAAVFEAGQLPEAREQVRLGERVEVEHGEHSDGVPSKCGQT